MLGLAPATAQSSAQAARALGQASFGGSEAAIDALTGNTFHAWIDAQMAIAPRSDAVDLVQSYFDSDPSGSYRPGDGGTNYTPSWIVGQFWGNGIGSEDQLRKRVVHALMQIFVVSLENSDLYDMARPFAHYIDNLGKHAFGNFHALLEDIALSPVMGEYLSHMRNEKADPSTGRMPDENFARELMQLFSIGLYQLNIDGSVKLGANGKPIETYNNTDVIGMARVFTGWAWNTPANTSQPWRAFWAGPGRYETSGSERFDLKPMRVHASYHETGIKQFLGVTIPANTDGAASLKIALDTLFNHPNVAPFIGKQLIQRLVTSNPSSAYVQRVAEAFNNNGLGVRGDMAAVIRAVLLHPEARNAPQGESGKLREPVLRVVLALKALGATSVTGKWLIEWDLRGGLQVPYHSPSVFNFYRPGYVPPNTSIASAGMVAPEMQIINETTVSHWVNFVWALLQWGVGWTGSTQDVTVDFNNPAHPFVVAAKRSDAALIDHLSKVLFAGGMSAGLRANILNAMQNQVGWNAATRLEDKIRIAAFIALVSSEFMLER